MSDIKKTPIRIDRNGKVKSVRISARIAPNYKSGLDLIARDRQTNLSEVLELAIIRLLNNYEIDNKKVMDFVGDSRLIFHSLFYDMRIQPASQETLKQMKKILESHLPKDVPLSLVSPKERYTAGIVDKLITKNSWTGLLPVSIIATINHGWNQALPANFILDIIEVFNAYSENVIIPLFSDKKIAPQEWTILCYLDKHPDIDLQSHYNKLTLKYNEIREAYKC